MHEIRCPAVTVDDPLLHRMRPAPDPESGFFWVSGRDGRLRIQRCRDCGYYIHPPTGHCPACEGDYCTPQPVSGHGTVHTFTVNHQPWTPGQKPFVIAIVELDEQRGLRLTSNVVDCAIDEVRIGIPVTVKFITRNGLWYPVFAPRDGDDD